MDPDDQDELDSFTHWDTSQTSMVSYWFQINPNLTPESVLDIVLTASSAVTGIQHGQAVIDIFPHADGSVTGEWLRISGCHLHWLATIGGRPDRHFGEIPDDLQDELVADGWNAVAKIDQNFQVVPCETCGIVHPFDFEFFPDDRPSQFRTVMKVVNAGRSVLGAPLGGWYIQASMTRDSINGDDPIQTPVAYLDLVEMIGPEYLEYAVWPVNSPFAILACELNLHDIHAGECSDNQS
jgi:hypothetical protein